jgi:hypothetical protein
LAGYCAFILPNSVDTENVATSYNAGVLKLELAKKPETQPKQIEIKAALEQLSALSRQLTWLMADN